jgi:hypothetical protein
LLRLIDRIQLLFSFKSRGSHDPTSKAAQRAWHKLNEIIESQASLADEIILWDLLKAIAQLMHRKVAFLKIINRI